MSPVLMPVLHEQPARAILAAAGRAGLNPEQIDLFEINEAFAAVSIVPPES